MSSRNPRGGSEGGNIRNGLKLKRRKSQKEGKESN